MFGICPPARRRFLRGAPAFRLQFLDRGFALAPRWRAANGRRQRWFRRVAFQGLGLRRWQRLRCHAATGRLSFSFAFSGWQLCCRMAIPGRALFCGLGRDVDVRQRAPLCAATSRRRAADRNATTTMFHIDNWKPWLHSSHPHRPQHNKNGNGASGRCVRNDLCWRMFWLGGGLGRGGGGPATRHNIIALFL